MKKWVLRSPRIEQPRKDTLRSISWESLDYLVGTGENRWWNSEAEHFCGSEIDEQVELGRLLHRQISWFGTGKNTTDIDAELAVRVRVAGAVTHQSTGLG